MCTDGEYIFILVTYKDAIGVHKKLFIEQYEVDMEKHTIEKANEYEVLGEDGQPFVEFDDGLMDWDFVKGFTACNLTYF